MLKGQRCDNATSAPHTREHSGGWNWPAIKDQDFDNLPLAHKEHRNTHPSEEVTGSEAPFEAAEYDNLRGADRPCCQKRWPSSHSLCSEQERKQSGQKKKKKTAEPKNSTCCWDTWEFLTRQQSTCKAAPLPTLIMLFLCTQSKSYDC